MPHTTESTYENAIIELLCCTLGYAHAYGPDVARDYGNPLYMDALLLALRQLSPKLPQAALDEKEVYHGTARLLSM